MLSGLSQVSGLPPKQWARGGPHETWGPGDYVFCSCRLKASGSPSSFAPNQEEGRSRGNH